MAPVRVALYDTEEPEFQLRKALRPLDITLFGIRVIIGTELYVFTGEAAAFYSGSAVALSYVVGGIACALAALCYGEFASTVPVAGSAYTFWIRNLLFALCPFLKFITQASQRASRLRNVCRNAWETVAL